MKVKSIDGLVIRDRQGGRSVGIDAVKRAPSKNVEAAIKSERKPVAAVGVQKSPSKSKRREINDFFKSVQDESPTELVSKKERRKLQKRKKKPSVVKRVILSVVGVVVVGIIGLGTWVWIQGNEFISQITDGGDLLGFLTSDSRVPLDKDPITGRTNVLVYGTEGYDMEDPQHDGGFLTDSIMVMSIDQDNGDVRTVSIPRDMKVKTCYATGKINELFQCTYRGKARINEDKAAGQDKAKLAEVQRKYDKLASESLAEAVEGILGIKIQYYIHVNWDALVKVVDSIGGVDVRIVKTGTKYDGEEVLIETTDDRGIRDGYKHDCKCFLVDFKNDTTVHLDGEHALALARARNHEPAYYGSRGGNFSREVYQQKLIAAIVKKANKVNMTADWGKMMSIKGAIGDNLRTSFKDTELRSAIRVAKDVDMENIVSVPLLQDKRGKYLLTTGMLCLGTATVCDESQKRSYVFPAAGAGNYGQIHEYIAKQFNLDPVVREEATVDILNGSGVAGAAREESERLKEKKVSVGKIADAPAGEWKKYTLYYVSGVSPATRTVLEKFYGVKAAVKLPDGIVSKADFVVIVGVQ